MSTPPTVEQRLRMVEVSIEVQAGILAGIQAELIEAARLTNSVDRLGEGASELGQALLQVDRNQQALTRLGKQLGNVETAAADAKTAVDVKAREDRTARRRLLAGGIVIASLLAASVGLVSQSAYDACKKRQQATLVDIAVLDGFRSGGPGDAPLDRAIGKYRDTLEVSCDEQYLLHLP